MGDTGKVGIVLVNYNGMKIMPECLDSLRALGDEGLKILVVDNASSDGSAEMVCERYPEVELIRLGENIGVAGGNNAGIRASLAAGCDYVLLLNNDTVVKPDFLAKLMEHAAPDILVAPKIYFHDEPTRINTPVGDMDLWRGVHKCWFYGQSDTPESQRAQFVTMANSCAILIPSGVFGKIGLMDEDYFMYADDTDFILRATRAGFRVKFAPESVVYHKVSSSSGGQHSPLTVYYANRNRAHFMRKHQRNPLILGCFFILYFATRLVYFGIYASRGQFRQMKALSAAMVDCLSGRMGRAELSRFS